MQEKKKANAPLKGNFQSQMPAISSRKSPMGSTHSN